MGNLFSSAEDDAGKLVNEGKRVVGTGVARAKTGLNNTEEITKRTANSTKGEFDGGGKRRRKRRKSKKRRKTHRRTRKQWRRTHRRKRKRR